MTAACGCPSAAEASSGTDVQAHSSHGRERERLMQIAAAAVCMTAAAGGTGTLDEAAQGYGAPFGCREWEEKDGEAEQSDMDSVGEADSGVGASKAGNETTDKEAKDASTTVSLEKARH